MTLHRPQAAAGRSSGPPIDVRAWRRLRLLEAGFPTSLAATVAADPRFDLHALLQLVDRGCSPELAVRILAPLPREVEGYEADAVRRLRVQPGLTGLWQVSGRSELSWDESLRLDLWYVDNWSLSLDAQILLRTAGAVLRGRGAY